MERTLVVGDIHGCRVELEALLEKCDYPILASVWCWPGISIAKGPDSAGVLALARQLGAPRGAGQPRCARAARFAQAEAPRAPTLRRPSCAR